MRNLAKFGPLRNRPLWKLAVALSVMLATTTLLAQSTLVTGKKITPAGTNTTIGNLPMNIIKSPDGKFAITTDMGFSQYLSSVDLSTGAVVSQVPYGLQPPAVTDSVGLYYGLAFAPGPPAQDGSYTLYAAQGQNQTIAVLSLSSTGALTSVSSIATGANDFPSGLATDDKGYIYVANNDSDNPGIPSSVAIYKSDGRPAGRYTFSASFGGTPNFPLAVATLHDGSKTYVTSQRDGAVYVLDTSDPTNPTLKTKIATGSHPAGLLLNASQSLLYVANAHSDTISAVSTSSDTVASTTLFRFRRLTNYYGATPIGLGLSTDGTTLYAAMGDLNAVAVASVSGNGLTVKGFIPVGWYPTGVVASSDNKSLLVTNAKGIKAKNPSTGYQLFTFNDNAWYDLNTIKGTVAKISVPNSTQLASYTNQVLVNNGLNNPVVPNHSLDAIGLQSGGITHVIYIVKENRTYDQVLGDVPQGNGDPSLVLFGSSITPNLHALAQRFVLLDNFYDAGEASGDGWPWSTQSMANEYVIKNLPYNYSNRGRNYDFEGQNNGYLTGGFPAKDPYGNTLSPAFPNGLPPVPDVAEAPGGHIWDAVRAAKLSYRNYGFFYSFGVSGVFPDNFPTATGLLPAGVSLGGVSDYDYRRYDAAYADSDAPTAYSCPYPTAVYGHYNEPSRYSEWKREFDSMLANNSVPAFMTVRFMHDHTQGYTAKVKSPQAQVADNDYGVGQLVEAISKSSIWQHTAIFVVEDDSQDGPDHVDAHRSTAYVISPYIKQSYVDHTFYNTDSILKTMEMLLGLNPLTQYDAVASAIVGPFDTVPSNTAQFTAAPAAQAIMCGVNPALKALKPGSPMHKAAVESAKMNFDLPDSAPSAKLNQILWKSVKGPNSKMPAPRHSVLADSKED